MYAQFVGRSCGTGTKPFAAVSAKPRDGNRQLRELLRALDIPDAALYRSHDLRRGHARDLKASGASWDEIMAKGDWSSKRAPCASYLPEELVEARSVAPRVTSSMCSSIDLQGAGHNARSSCRP